MRVVSQDAPEAAGERQPLAVVLDNLRSAYNVGNIFRLGEICGVRKLVLCGYTAAPPHPKLRKTARGCDERVPCEQFATSVAAVRALRAEGYSVIGVETVAGAPYPWNARWEWPVAFVFGNEALGIDAEALALCDGVVRLPVFGTKNSLNVSNCAAAVLYAAVQRLV